MSIHAQHVLNVARLSSGLGIPDKVQEYLGSIIVSWFSVDVHSAFMQRLDPATFTPCLKMHGPNMAYIYPIA